MKCKCLRCGNEWESIGKKPKVCPRCKSYAWNIPRIKEKKKTAMDFLRMPLLSILNVIAILGAVVTSSFFYFKTDDHMIDKDIHISVELMKVIDDEIQELRDRVELYEWQHGNEVTLNARRHKSQGDDITRVIETQKSYEGNMKEVRKILFDAFIQKVTK